MGGVLDLLARGSLLHEKGPRPLFPRATYQGAGRCRRDPVDPLGSLPRRRPQLGSMARWPRAPPLRARAGARDLGPRIHRAQLGHTDVGKGRTGAGDQRPLPPGPPPYLLWHPGRGCRHRGGAELDVAYSHGPGRSLLRLQRDRRGALPEQAVPRHLPDVQALDQDARALHLLTTWCAVIRSRTRRAGRLVEELEAMGYEKTSGCTWERVLDERRTASTDLLIPAYTSRPRVNKEIDSNGTKVVTTEVPGLAEALRRTPVRLPVRFVLSDRRAIETEVLLIPAYTSRPRVNKEIDSNGTKVVRCT